MSSPRKAIRVIEGRLEAYYKENKKGRVKKNRYWKFDATEDEGNNVFSLIMSVNVDIENQHEQPVTMSCYEYVRDKNNDITYDCDNNPLTRLRQYKVTSFTIVFKDL